MDRELKILGEQRYAFHVPAAGIVFELERIRRSSHELWGELLVRVNGKFPLAKTFDDGILQAGDLNLSSVQARATRARLIGERAGDTGSVDWYGLIEEFSIRVISAERAGSPDVDLRDVPKPGPDRWMTFDGIELPVKHPTVIFGDGGSAKSYFALYWAGRMVADLGMAVLYVDWEWTKEEHRERLELLFGPIFPHVRHLEVYRSLRDERERIQRVIRARGINFVIFDSVALACGGDPSGSEACTTYWQIVRQFGLGSLHVAHVTKGFNGKADDQKPFGSAFWHNMARATYNMKGEPMGQGAIGVGIFSRKSQWGHRVSSAFKVQFDPTKTLITPIELTAVAGLEDGLPIIDRITNVVTEDPKTRKELSQILGADLATIQKVVYREVKRGHLVELPGKKGQQRIGVPEGAEF